MKRSIQGSLALALLASSGAALAGHKIGGDGPASNMEYEFQGTQSATLPGAVTILFDDVTVRYPRMDIGRIYWLAGIFARATNTSNEPLCFAFYFEPIDYNMVNWGSEQVRYLGAHKSTGYIAGIYKSEDSTEPAGFDKAHVHTWRPIAKNQCGPDPQA